MNVSVGNERATPEKCIGSSKARAERSSRRAKTKQDRLIAMLSRSKGAKASSLAKSLGWQSHTVRAAISRLRKQGHSIEVDKATGTGGSTYSIRRLPEGEDLQTAGSLQ